MRFVFIRIRGRDQLFMLTPTYNLSSAWVENYTGNKSLGWAICPDFLRRLVALAHSMRLSLMKGAHAGVSSTAWQETGVKP